MAKEYYIKRCSTELKLNLLITSVIEINSENNVVQIFDAEKVINKNHLIAAYLNSEESFKSNTNIAKSRSLEMLLYASMSKQITEAIKKIGAKSTRDFILFCNSGAAYDSAKRLIKDQKEFNPTEEVAIRTAKEFGIEAKYGELDQFVIQKIAVSRIDY